MRPDDGLLPPFLGALQACVSVLLTMCYGVAARRLSLIHDATINDMSALGVKLFLPALIVVNLGKELHIGTALNYIPVLGKHPGSGSIPGYTYLLSPTIQRGHSSTTSHPSACRMC
jgi:hypothetical protein